jgi:hypothetical protein
MIVLSKLANYDPPIAVASYWRNLVEHVHKTNLLPDAVWRQIYEELAVYGATVRGDDIIFETEEQVSLFLLRWA